MKLPIKILKMAALILLTMPLAGKADQLQGMLLSTQRVSVSDQSGAEASGGGSTEASFSADGRYVVFSSSASNLVVGDTNGLQDIFLRDRQTGTTERISVDSSGQQANAESFAPVVSADGRYVAFHSLSNTLVSGDNNGQVDVFLRDRTAGTTIRVSVGPAAIEGNNASAFASISDDGNKISFVSIATNLVVGDANNQADVFVYDRTLATTTRFSESSTGAEADDESLEAQLSRDGQWLVFSSKATNLVATDTNDCADIFLKNLSTNAVQLVSKSTAGVIGNLASSQPRVNTTGTFVAFSSRANNLVASDSNGFQDVFVHNVSAGTTTRVSVDDTGQALNNVSEQPSLSVTGRFVSFSTVASGVAADTNGQSDVYLRDTIGATTTLVSESVSSAAGSGPSSWSVLSENGAEIVFESTASDLVSGDTNSESDIFVEANDIPNVLVSVSQSATQLTEGTSSTVDFTFSRTGGTTEELTARLVWSKSDAKALSDYGVPVGGGSYDLPPEQITFAIGETDKVITLEVLDDGEVEQSEFIVASLANGDDYLVWPGKSEVSVELVDDSDAPAIGMYTDQQVIREVGQSRLTFTDVILYRVNGTGGDVTVNLLVGGTAESGLDFVSLPAQVVIPNGQSSASIRVQAIDDSIAEDYESIEISIAPDASYTIWGAGVTIAIKDSDSWLSFNGYNELF